ncbi:hypothetical protein H310_12476 [Aphanomyces invadans]|uniref:HSF-type DNA-binding domain-containing protein n=1 Tax=Aphanomyces invadans TaxID=157072 RepID=A0A024TK28_9STRA|nr:hypothetical protein H310_12476 [Aphanomyces invadans]ETV93712.1 hypothetical protein H310_12476 [Aphanomyces invadans]|eukprot:XP_008877753.1 hypothetical protein H310_12476 [Aphanomyces invadans]
MATRLHSMPVSTVPSSASPAPFLVTLRIMLESENPDVLRWTPDSKAFQVLDLARFSHSVLPKYFKHRKYASFQRQLNYFHFKKWTKRQSKVCTFSNIHFCRHDPALAMLITRKRSSTNGSTHNASLAAFSSSRSSRTSSDMNDDLDVLLDFNLLAHCLPPVALDLEVWW